jgi:hypothetical protein
VDLSGTSHINYLVIKTYKLVEQTGSYMPDPTREEYGYNLFTPFEFIVSGEKVASFLLDTPECRADTLCISLGLSTDWSIK